MAKLLGYTVINSSYTTGAAGNINVSSGPTVSVDKDQVTSLNGDPSVHSFFDAGGNLRVVVAQYDFGGSPIGFRIYDPSTTPWTAVTGTLTWASVVNLYGVVKLGNFLYAVDFDGANVAKISLTGGTPYAQVGSYHYGVTGKTTAGVSITADDTNVYALFIVADDSSFSSYQNSTVVKLDVSATNPAAVATASVGKNAFTLVPYDSKLYVACVGGAQQAGSYNSGSSKLDVVTMSSMAVTTAFTASSSAPVLPGDFRDITFSDSGDAYIFTGYYDSSFANLNGKLYVTTAANINASPPNIGSNIFTFTAPGYFWATLYQDDPVATDIFWFAKGNPIQIFQPPPTSGLATPIATKTPSDLGSGSVNANLNSITPFWEPSALARAAAPQAAVGKSFAAHARLAAEARRLAEELQKK